MKHTVKLASTILAALWATTAGAADIQFHGYARAGVGLNTKGGGQTCFQLSGADTKFRLGNECDYVVEPNFRFDILKADDQSVWGFHVMPSIYKAYDNQSTNVRAGDGTVPGVDNNTSIGNAQWFDDLPVRFGQVYFYGENVPLVAHGTVWIGRRFYDRLQTGINDQFLENEDGDGAGVEDMNLGFGKLSLAFLMNPNDTPRTDTQPDPVGDVNNKVYRVTGRLTDLKTFGDGRLGIWAGARNIQSKSTKPGGANPATVKSTYRVAAYHNVSLGTWGNNLLGFKYETLGENSNQWRVVTQHGVNFSAARTSLDLLAEYRRTKPQTGNDTSWLALGARTDTQLSGPLRFLLEAGYDQVDDGEQTNSLTKITGALALSAGKDAGARPTFRLFYTHAIWSDQGVLASARTNDVFGDETSGGTFGLQAEGWW
jgi:maltoporin